MSQCNPIRETLKHLENEYRMLHLYCLHFNVEINALIQERTNSENKKLKRRVGRCLRLVDALKPETSNYYKDKSKQIRQMLHHVGLHYDDLKQRYMWALDRLAEATLKLNRVTDVQQNLEAKNGNPGNKWKDFCRYNDEDKLDSPKKGKGIEDVDKLLGLMIISNNYESPSWTENKKCNSGRVYTKVTKTSKLTKIEDFPQADERETGDHLKGLRILFKKLRKSRKSKNCITEDEKQEMANATEIRIGMYALMAEVAERDELIDSLVAQIKMKDVQISKLLNVIRQQKLGLNSDIL